jgi:hypothetical protein
MDKNYIEINSPASANVVNYVHRVVPDVGPLAINGNRQRAFYSMKYRVRVQSLIHEFIGGMNPDRCGGESPRENLRRREIARH